MNHLADRDEHMQVARRTDRQDMGLSLVIAAGIGLLTTALWSYHFVDDTIGTNVANTLLGQDAKTDPVGGLWAGALFAFVTGLAGTVTACNVCVLSAVAPATGCARPGLCSLAPLGWMLVAAILVSALYGAFGVAFHALLPQMSDHLFFGAYPARLMQASAIYVPIGAIFVIWGLMHAGMLRNPFTGISDRWPMAPHLLMGTLIGAFLIGRPFPLFRKMFAHAVEIGSPLYGAMVFTLQVAGNMLIINLMIMVLTIYGGRLHRWLHADAARSARFTAIGFVAGGTFLIAYWGMRVPSIFGLGWFPVVNW